MAAIFNYFDYREYLKDDFTERKKKSPGFSLRSMAIKLKLSSSTLIRIFNGKRNISENLLPKFITYLGLRSKEAEYFTHLVNFCQVKSERQRTDEYTIIIPPVRLSNSAGDSTVVDLTSTDSKIYTVSIEVHN